MAQHGPTEKSELDELTEMGIDPNQRPKYSEYRDSYVAFLDLLGFTETIRGIGTRDDFDKVSWLLFTIKQLAKRFSDADGLFKDLAVTAVSDSIILTIPRTAPAAGILFVQTLHHIQYNLISGHHTMLRGFVSQGTVYHRNGTLFGTGYLKAYDGETSLKGGPPRIVIDTEIVENARSAISRTQATDGMVSIFKYLDTDDDNVVFIDYLRQVGTATELGADEVLIDRNRIRKFVSLGIKTYANDNGIIDKYKWLRDYCDRRFV